MLKILIADDKEENRFVLKNFFKLFGKEANINLLEASTGEESINMIKIEKPDLVLLDIQMDSENSGFEVIKTIKKNKETAQIPIWAITAHALEAFDKNESDKEKCLKAGFNDFLSKPFDAIDLLNKTSLLLKLTIPEKIKQKIEKI